MPALRAMLSAMSFDIHGKTALVTGAASGIGRETALALARAGASLVICDVHEENLATVAKEVRELGRSVIARRVDVSDRAAMKAFADEVHHSIGAVDILVNNAGVALSGGFMDTSLEDWDWILGINVYGVIYGCHYFLPPMIERGRGGQVVIVSSAAGYTASDMLAAYSTTKFSVLGLAENLRLELKQHRIGVSAICPGIVDTAITRNTRQRGPTAGSAFTEKLSEFYRKRGFGPDKVAKAIVRAIERDQGVVPVTPEAWAFYLVKRASPRLFERFAVMAGKQARRKFSV